MTSPLTMTVHRPAGRLGSYVRAFQVFSTTEPAGASVLDFGGADVSVPVCFADPVLVEDWGAHRGRQRAPASMPHQITFACPSRRHDVALRRL
jgi:hypothetical protein